MIGLENMRKEAEELDSSLVARLIGVAKGFSCAEVVLVGPEVEASLSGSASRTWRASVA